MPQRVVIHVHCVETISWAVRADAEARLGEKLEDFAWRFIPYARPGLPLARAINSRLAPGVDVLVLGNHGLVAAAETVDAAARLLASVSRALAVTPRPFAPAAMTRSVEGYRVPGDARIHSLATDPMTLALVSQGTLYPDHAIFLGPGAAVWPARGKFILVPGEGVLIDASAPAASADALALCLADVAARLEPGARLRVLTAEDEDRLVNWDAEKYRQELAAGNAGGA